MHAPPDALIDHSLQPRLRSGMDAVQPLVNLCHELDIELIHVMDPPVALTGIAAARLADIAITVNCPFAPLRQDNSRTENLRFSLRWRLIGRGAHKLLTPNEVVKRNLIALTSIAATKVEVVYPSYPLPPSETPSRESLGLPDGHLVGCYPPAQLDDSYKYLFDVQSRLYKRGTHITLVVLGEGETVSLMRSQIASVRPAPPVRWFTHREDLLPVMSACDVIVDCASRDYIPEGLIYAMLSSRPIVATRQNGITELLEPNVAALFVAPDDPSDMALQVNRLLQYEGLAHRLGSTAYKRGMERFSPTAHMRAFTEFCESAVYCVR
jgi:glycosyltransferase involved in cell wall biosynthesis